MKDDVTSPDKSKRANEGNGADFSAWMGSSIHAWESWAHSRSSMMKDSYELAQEMLKFWQTRFQADIDALKALIACGSPRALFECHKAFAEKATAQYVEEASKLSNRMISIMSNVAVPFRDQGPKS